MAQETEHKGLRKRRQRNSKKDKVLCDNCGCERFSPCTCMKKVKGKE